jgi:hypothetical protein
VVIVWYSAKQSILMIRSADSLVSVSSGMLAISVNYACCYVSHQLFRNCTILLENTRVVKKRYQSLEQSFYALTGVDVWILMCF